MFLFQSYGCVCKGNRPVVISLNSFSTYKQTGESLQYMPHTTVLTWFFRTWLISVQNKPKGQNSNRFYKLSWSQNELDRDSQWILDIILTAETHVSFIKILMMNDDNKLMPFYVKGLKIDMRSRIWFS